MMPVWKIGSRGNGAGGGGWRDGGMAVHCCLGIFIYFLHTFENIFVWIENIFERKFFLISGRPGCAIHLLRQPFGCSCSACDVQSLGMQTVCIRPWLHGNPMFFLKRRSLWCTVVGHANSVYSTLTPWQPNVFKKEEACDVQSLGMQTVCIRPWLHGNPMF